MPDEPTDQYDELSTELAARIDNIEHDIRALRGEIMDLTDERNRLRDELDYSPSAA